MNTWIGSTPNLELDVYNISSILSDDITAEQLLMSLINYVGSNTTKVDDFAGEIIQDIKNIIEDINRRIIMSLVQPTNQRDGDTWLELLPE